MSDLSKYPPEAVVDYFSGILARSKMWSPAKDLRETAGEMTVYPTVEQAWLIWAAIKWLDVILTLNTRTEEGRSPIEQCMAMLRGITKEMKAQPAEEKIVSFSRKDLRILSDATLHLDRFCISREKDQPRKFQKGAKKK